MRTPRNTDEITRREIIFKTADECDRQSDKEGGRGEVKDREGETFQTNVLK